jgi:hypothetical protein
MDHMVNLISFETEDLCKPSSNLIQTQHTSHSIHSIELGVIQASSHDYRVEVIMTKLSSLMPWETRVVPKHSSI